MKLLDRGTPCPIDTIWVYGRPDVGSPMCQRCKGNKGTTTEHVMCDMWALRNELK
jgi:hypothetical protein